MGVWGFAKDAAKGAWSLLTVWRRWGQEDRAEIEETYKGEIATLKEQLSETEDEAEQGAIKQHIKRYRSVEPPQNQDRPNRHSSENPYHTKKQKQTFH